MSKYLDFFSHEEARIIKDAIVEAEGKTSGEIRIHVEDFCNHQAMDRATYVFNKLNMNNTKERNGVLFYISAMDQQFAVWGDEGIHEKVGDQYWSDMTRAMEKEFRDAHFVEGLKHAIHKAGDTLAKYFPIHSRDLNELSDEISIGDL